MDTAKPVTRYNPTVDTANVPEEYFEYDNIYAVVWSLLVWRTAYICLRLSLPSRAPEFCSRVVAAAHGCFIAFIGVNQCFEMDSPFDHPEWRTSYLQSFLMSTSLGYFVHDLIWCLHNGTETKLMILHHIYSCYALWRMLKKKYSGAQTTCALGCMEITNPFLQVRWFIRSAGLYPSALFSSAEVTFLITFFTIRIVLGTYFMFIIFTQPANDWEFLLLAFMIYAMSWMFLVNIIKYLKVKYIRKAKEDKQQVGLST